MIQPIAIAALLLVQAAPPAANPPCVSREGVRDAAMVMAPHLVEAIAEKCRASLPAGAFLSSRGTEFVARLKSEAAGRSASAATVLSAFAGEKLPQIGGSDALLTVAVGIASSAIASEVKPESCGEYNTLVEAIAPLPSENVGRALASVLVLSETKEPAICPNG